MSPMARLWKYSSQQGTVASVRYMSRNCSTRLSTCAWEMGLGLGRHPPPSGVLPLLLLDAKVSTSEQDQRAAVPMQLGSRDLRQ